MNNSNIPPITFLSGTLGSFQNIPSNQSLGSDPTVAKRNRIELLKFRLTGIGQFSTDVSRSSLEELYKEVFELLPDFDEETVKSLSHLLKQSPQLIDQQLQLAMGLGKLYMDSWEWKAVYDASDASIDLQFAYYKKAIYFYAKAIQIAEHAKRTELEKECHQAASRVFILLIRNMHGNMHGMMGREKSFFYELDEARRRNQPDEFKAVYKRIDQYRLFCTCAKDYQDIIINKFHGQVILVLNLIKENKERYKEVVEDASKLINNPFPEHDRAVSYLTEKYKRSLSLLRDKFKIVQKATSIKEIREFQETMFKEYKEFFLQLLRDAFNMVGPPPPSCGYDYQALGSLGLGEPCPCSDLEPMTLLSDRSPEACSYFKLLSRILELQIGSLGETRSPDYNQIIFSCVHRENPEGFHMDSGPHEEDALINTPAGMARLQNASNVDPASVDHLVLQSRSLYRNEAEIFEDYQRQLKGVLEVELPCQMSRRRWRALGFIKTRLLDFQNLEREGKYEHTIIHVKTLYVLQLNYLLGDIAFYLGVRHQNTLDTIEEIASTESFNHIFTPESIFLLKGAVAALYKIRCRLHLKYGRQEEQAYIPSQSLLVHEIPLAPLWPEEIFELKKIRFLILRPLYTLLDEVFRSESSIGKTTQTLFEEKFKNIDFVKLAFDQVPKHPTISLRSLAVQTFVSYLKTREVSAEDYLFYYQKLSDLSGIEHLRNNYINTLESLTENTPTLKEILKKLYAYPNSYGLRQLESKLRGDFEATMLDNITTERKKYGKDGLFVVIDGPALDKSRFLDPEITSTLLDSSGVIRDAHPRFCFSKHFFYFKLQHPNSPWHPGNQQAATRLLLRIFGREIIISEPMKLSVYSSRSHHPIASYFVEISMTPVTSETTLSNLPEKDLNQINQRQLSELFLSLPLILPANSWETAYLFSPIDDETGEPSSHIMPIDYSDAWVKPLVAQSQRPLKCCVNLSWLLFSKFPEMTLHPDVIASFLSLKPKRLLEGWYKDLSDWNNMIRSHFGEEGSSLFCLLNEEAGTRLLIQFERLQEFLKQHQDKKILGVDVLKTIVTMQNGEIVEIGELLFEHFKAQKANMFRNGGYRNSLIVSASYASKFQKILKSEEKKTLYTPLDIIKEIEDDICFNQSICLVKGEKGMCLEKGFESMQQEEKPDLELQMRLLNKLIPHSYEKLNLSFCAVLNDKMVEEFLEKSSQILISLDLQMCPQITDEGLKNIETCLNLERLYISHCNISDESLPRIARCLKLKELLITNCKNIRVFGAKVSGFRAYYHKNDPLIFPSLEKLEISSCPNLCSIICQAEKLDEIIIENNPLLILTPATFSYKVKSHLPVLKRSTSVKETVKTTPPIPEGQSISEIKEEKSKTEAKSAFPPSLPRNTIDRLEKKSGSMISPQSQIGREDGYGSKWLSPNPPHRRRLRQNILTPKISKEEKSGSKEIFKEVDQCVEQFFNEYDKFKSLPSVENVSLTKAVTDLQKQIGELTLFVKRLAEIKELENTFYQTLETLKKKKKELVQRNYSSLSEVSDLNLLRKYEWVRPEVEELIPTLVALQTKSSQCSYEQEINTFLREIRSKALFYMIRERLDVDIDAFTKEQLEELRTLNQYYQKLSGLNRRVFEKACQYARDKFVKGAREKIDHLLKTINESYCSQMQKAITTCYVIKYLPACFSVSSEVNSILKEVEDTIRVREAERRKMEIDLFKRKVDDRFLEDAKIAIKGYVSLHFTQIAELQLKPEDMDSCLSELKKLVPRSSLFSEIWAEVKEAKRSESQRYYKPDDQLGSLQGELKAKLEVFFRFIELYSRVLSLQEELNTCLSEIEKQAKEIIKVDPQKFVDHPFTLQAGFSEESLARLKTLENDLIKLKEESSNEEEICRIICAAQEKDEHIRFRLINEAGERVAESRIET